MKDSATAKNKNRRIRQEALREQLANQGHVQHIVDILDKLRDETQEIDAGMVNRYKITIDSKLKLLAKYLPDLKAVEHTGPEGGAIQVEDVSRPQLTKEEWMEAHGLGTTARSTE